MGRDIRMSALLRFIIGLIILAVIAKIFAISLYTALGVILIWILLSGFLFYRGI